MIEWLRNKKWTVTVYLWPFVFFGLSVLGLWVYDTWIG